jgi:release factor glutamine methyltransferase
MNTVGELLTLMVPYLENRGISPGRREAENILSLFLRCKRVDLYLCWDKPIEEDELLILRHWVKRRVQGEPIEYIAGEIEFFGIRLEISPAVLIPRQETEILTAKIADRIAHVPTLSLWDLCCGSGAIGLSIKKKFPSLDVTLSDLSLPALEVARHNAQIHNLDVTFLQGDLLEPFAGNKADIIVCNPPYVSEKEYVTMDTSVRLFEPKEALVGGEDGLLFYRRLACEAVDMLKEGGELILEIGYRQGEALFEIFADWKKKEIEHDWSGKDRFLFVSL